MTHEAVEAAQGHVQRAATVDEMHAAIELLRGALLEADKAEREAKRRSAPVKWATIETAERIMREHVPCLCDDDRARYYELCPWHDTEAERAAEALWEAGLLRGDA